MLKKDVLRKKSDFSALYNKGKSVGDRYVVVFHRKNGLAYNRIAFLASKKVGKAVARNRARRLLKESFKGLRHRVGNGYDIIFIARTTINGKKCGEVLSSMESALKREGLLIKKKER